MDNICDCAGYLECNGELYESLDGQYHRCRKHIVLHEVWCETKPPMDLYDWLNALDENTVCIIQDEMIDLPMWYWKPCLKP